MNVTSHAELVAVFCVAMQEHGTYRSRDFFLNNNVDPSQFDSPVSDVEYASAIRPSPASPIGQIVDAAVFVPPLSPSPVLCMQLFARTVTTVALSGSYDNVFQLPMYGHSSTSQSDTASQQGAGVLLPSVRMIELGKFMFNKAQTASLMAGDEVTATTWMTAYPALPERNDPGWYVDGQNGESYSLWPQASRPFSILANQYTAADITARFWLNFKVRLNIED